jgi:hypothetical protein
VTSCEASGRIEKFNGNSSNDSSYKRIINELGVKDEYE